MNEENGQRPLRDNKDDEVPKPPTDWRIPSALARTGFSSEQTLMSWIRTCLSLFTLGFAIAQFFDYLEDRQGVTQMSPGPRRLGLALVCVGIVALVLALVEHIQRIRKIKEQGMPPDAVSFLPIGSALALLAIGVVALFSILLGWSI